jgi:hypothetical protein
MAYIYGSPGQEDITASFDGRKATCRATRVPLLFLLALSFGGLHAFLQASYILTALSAVFFVFQLLRIEELGLTLAQRLSGSEPRPAPTGWWPKHCASCLRDTMSSTDLDLGEIRIDHAVVGPNGFFPIM